MFRFQLESQKLSSRCTCKKNGVMDLAMSTYDFSYTLVQLGGLKGKWDPEKFQGNSQIGGKYFFPPKLNGWNLKMMVSRDFGLQVNHVKFQGCRHHLARKNVQLQRIAEPHGLSPFPAELAGWTNEKKTLVV